MVAAPHTFQKFVVEIFAQLKERRNPMPSNEKRTYKNKLAPFPDIDDPTKTKILTMLTSQDDIRALAGKIAKYDDYLSQELYCELFLELSKKSEDVLVESYLNGQLAGLIFKICFNLFNSNSSSFYYKIKEGNKTKVRLQDCEEVKELVDDSDDSKELKLQLLEKNIKHLTPLQQKVIGYFLQLGSIKAVTKQFKEEFINGIIPVEIKDIYIRQALKAAKQELKNLIEKDLGNE